MRFLFWSSRATLVAAALLGFSRATAQSADPGWPRIFKDVGRQLTVYQPQVDYWHGYTNIHFHCAIGLEGVLEQEKFGVAEVDAVTVTDQIGRFVAMVPTMRDIRFPNCTPAESDALRAVVNRLRPMGEPTIISLDRVLAYLNPAEHSTQSPVQLNLDPPKIFYSKQPAILVMILGEPRFKPVETNRTDLEFALNTNWDLFRDPTTQHYYLLDEDSWLSAPDVKGPWNTAESLPVGLWSLPNNENWADVHQNLPGKRAKTAPAVYVSFEPAELIVTQGDPNYSPIKGTQLMRVTDTESTLFKNAADNNFYFLVAGRWFRATDLHGPWQGASTDLPADFARIPDNDPAAFVKASVPGIREASDAVLLASIPTTTTVYTTNVTVKVVYSGTPQFVPIQTTTVQAAANTSQQVFLVNGSYYCCDAGVWFISPVATGPWTYCTSVPAAIYTIPPSSPYHNVTYVVVQSSTPTTVVYAQTAGYSGEYVAATGVLMFGAGMIVGAAIANNYYYPPYPCFYSYGCCATYHYGYGGYYYGGGPAYGPYGGAGYCASYNPSTGVYSRSAAAYGPYGSASAQAACNPYTGGWARSAQVSTPYGSAGRAAGYNPYTGTYAAGGYRSTSYGTAAASRTYNPYTGAQSAHASASTAYGSAGRGAYYNPTTDTAARSGYQSTSKGTVAGIQTSEGSGAAGWNTAYGQGAVGKTQSDDVYAAKDGTVYKKDSGGGWSQNSGSGWESVQTPQPKAGGNSSGSPSSWQAQATSFQQQRSSGSWSDSSSWSQNRSSMESQAQSRSWGNQQHERSQSWLSSERSAGGGSRSWGGGRRR